jgi:hypothetical protein
VFHGAERIAGIAAAAAAGHYRDRVRAAVTAVNGVPGVVAEVDCEISVVSHDRRRQPDPRIAVVRNPEKVGRATRSCTGASETLGRAAHA